MIGDSSITDSSSVTFVALFLIPSGFLREIKSRFSSFLVGALLREVITGELGGGIRKMSHGKGGKSPKLRR